MLHVLTPFLLNNIIDIPMLLLELYCWIPWNYCFGPFLTPNSETVDAITPKINTNLPFVVWNLDIKFHKDQPTNTKIIARKPSVNDDEDHDTVNNNLQSYKNSTDRQAPWYTIQSTVSGAIKMSVIVISRRVRLVVFGKWYFFN